MITHNTIAYNPRHGIVAEEVGKDLRVEHNIVSNNQGGIVCLATEPDFVEIKCNDVWGNEYGNSCGNPGSDGNISLEPLFCNGPARDLRLHANSPCAPEQNVCGLVGALPVGCEVLRVPAPTARLEEITLDPVHPNPSTIPIHIQFEIARQAELRLEIFDAAGRRCAVLADRSFAAGRHALTWSGKDAHGRAVRPGVYLAVLRSGDLRRTQTFVVIH